MTVDIQHGFEFVALYNLVFVNGMSVIFKREILFQRRIIFSSTRALSLRNIYSCA